MCDRLRIFLDANVLFSATYKPEHRFLIFWRLSSAIILTSNYAADEARRNCDGQEHLARLEDMLLRTEFVTDVLRQAPPAGIDLPEKDWPILAAAIRAGANHLITGDRNHFGQWMHQAILTPAGFLTISTPGEFLKTHPASV